MVKHTFRVERVYGINGKCRLYVALQSHGRSLRRCSSERTHPQRSPLGRCLGAPKWQMDFCKLPNQITRIILDERSNLTFTRSGATASSLCLSHDSDFGGGRLSCDFEEENEHFSEYSTVSKTTKSKTVIRIFMKPRRQKGFLSSQPKSLFLLCFSWNLLPAFYRRNARVRRVLGLRTSSRCHWCSCACVRRFLLIQNEKCCPRPGHGEFSFLASPLFRGESQDFSRGETLSTEDMLLGNETQSFGA